jgi:hypothetical protein
LDDESEVLSVAASHDILECRRCNCSALDPKAILGTPNPSPAVLVKHWRLWPQISLRPPVRELDSRRENPCSLPRISLFPNSGNIPVNPREEAALRRMARPRSPAPDKFPVFSLQIRNLDPETGSHQTACTCLFSKFIRGVRWADRVSRARPSSCFAPAIPVMKPADARQSDDLGAGRRTGIQGSADRSVLKRSVDTLRVVVADVLAEQSS